MDKLCGSIVVNGTKYTLLPGENALEGGLVATLEHKNVSPRAQFALLRLKNCGSENSPRVTNAKGNCAALPVQVKIGKARSVRGASAGGLFGIGLCELKVQG